MSFAAILAAALTLQAQVREEAKDWRLLKTENFDVHYPSDDLEARARHFAGLFEEARGVIAERAGAALKRRVTVFLYRSVHDLASSSANARAGAVHPGRLASGPAAPRPEPTKPCCRLGRARAFAFAEPLQDRIFIHCQASDRWNAWFARHELVHQLQFQELFPLRVPSWVIAARDGITPQWFWEGFADYAAGIFEGGKDEYVRDLASEHLFTLGEMFDGQALNDHDYIAVYYLGSMFFLYLEKTLGKDVPGKVLKAYSEGIPLTINAKLTAATGKGTEELERGFRGFLQERYGAAMASRTEPTERLTDTRRPYRIRTFGGRWSPDGNRLAYVSRVDVVPEVYVDGRGLLGLNRFLGVESIHSPPSWSPDGRRVVVAASWKNRDYLLLAGVDGGVQEIRPDFDEVVDPAWSPTGEEIVFSGLKSGTADLYVLKLSDGTVTRLTRDEGDDRHPAWSPDGARIAFVHEERGRTELTVIGRDGEGRAVVTRTNAQVERPQWMPGGAGVVVSADVDGIYDAFLVDVATGAVSRLTHFRNGVHHPAPSPDGKRIVVSYTSRRGSDLFAVPVEPRPEPRWVQEGRAAEYDAFAPADPRGVPAGKSRPFSLDWLMAPTIGESFVVPGAQLRVSDLDAENEILFGAYWAGTLWSASLSVVNTRWRPTLGAELFAERDGDVRREGFGPFVAVPITPFMSVSAGWLVRRTAEEDSGLEFEVEDSGPSASFTIGREAGWLIFDPSWGATFTVARSWFRESLGGERDLDELSAWVEGSYAIEQDLVVWGRLRYRRRDGPMLPHEPPSLDEEVRGADGLLATDVGSVSVELRLPLARDLRWMPGGTFGLPEYLFIKDLRFFAFLDAASAGLSFSEAFDDEFRAISIGVGVRLDFLAIPWPLTTRRAPLRVEVWMARVAEDFDDPFGTFGFALRLPF